MSPLISGLIPIAAAIALGWVIRKTGLVPAQLWGGITKLSYVALLPALLFVTIGTADFSGLPTGAFLTAATLGFLGMGGLALSLRPVVPTDGPTFTSVFQGAIRWNGFVVLALAQASFSSDQAALVAIVFAPTVPLINVLCVAVLSVWGAHEGAVNLGGVVRRILTNPLIIGCIAGALANATPVLRPDLVMETAGLVGRAALPLILLAIGAGLDFAAVQARPLPLSLAVVLKLITAPLLFIGLGILFQAPSDVLMVLAAIGAAPGAASSYVLAKELGGDAELTAGHVTVTTILAFVSIPFFVALAAKLNLP